MGFGIRGNGIPRSPVAWFALRIRDFLAVLALYFLLITFTPATIWWTTLLEGPTDHQTGRVMVVLAGSSMDADILGQGSYLRAAFAVREAGLGKYERILLSGGVHTSPTAAAEMKKFLIAAGINAKMIETEDKSESTRENAQFSAKMLRSETRPIALVTSDYHMRRSAALFAKQGIRVLRRPYSDAKARSANRSYRFEISYELAVETAKTIYYKLRRWT